jgi:SPX domain protein involved in polyphosphate accumulation
MNQFQGTFKRYEKKYLLNEKKYKILKQKLQEKLTIDHFGKTTICNIYFDTPDHLLIRTSMEKPLYKEKLRLRSYGTPQTADPVFVEIKKKYKGIVYKRREKMDLLTARQYLYEQVPINPTTQIMKEINWFLQFYQDLEPAMYISYSRIAMYGMDDPDLRITFDSDILWREEDLSLESGSWGNPILQDGFRLMEVKIPGTMPLWLSHLLNELEIYPVSFSKYGNGYEQSVQMKKIDKNKGEIKYA